MSTRLPPSPPRPPLARGFVAGVLGVLVFHQGTIALLRAAGTTRAAPYAMQPTAPFGVPQVASAAFWGGLWGVLLAALLWRAASRGRYWLQALLFGALGPTLVAWFVVAPLKDRPIAAGGDPAAMLVGLLVNGAWGIGTALFLRLLATRADRR